jgi:hypothetical protein
MKKTLKLLIIEDSEDDALLVLHQIRKAGYDIDYERVQTVEEMDFWLHKKKWDVILSDYVMPHFNGSEALALLSKSGIDIPFIVVSGTIGEEVAVSMMKAGAHDYLMKNNLQRLIPAIERELRDSKDRTERKLLLKKQKQAEELRMSHLEFFKNLDKINQTILRANDLEQMMSDVLNTMLPLFDCDRAWLFYPCDPEAKSFRVPMEITKPEYPGAGILNVDVPMPPDMAQDLRDALESSEPVTYMAGTEKPINKVSAEQFGVKSQMMIVLYPKTGKPWMFGMHQCSHIRIWTPEEKQLFQEIGRRLSDSLTSMLIYRDLRNSEAENRAIVDTVPDLLFRVNRGGIIIDFRKPERMDLYVESAQFLGRSIGDVLPANVSEAAYPAIEEALKTNEVVTFEYNLILKGQFQYFEGRMIAFSNDEVLVLVRNISERKQAEHQLIESEQKFRSLAESSPDNIIRYDKECRAVYINHNLSLTVGADVVSLIGKTPMESNDYPGTADYQTKLEQVIQSGQPDEIDVIVPDTNGELRIHQVRFVAELNNDFQIIGALAIGRDITDQRQAEIEIARMNRSLRMLSDVNQALIHITDEKALLNEVCRIVVEIGGYRMTWVGFSEQNEAKSITPVARSGYDAGYVDSLNLSWADADRGHGPCGIAIRTGQPFVVRNIQAESCFALWLDQAIQHGYHSFIALPLICENQTHGVIAIYSPETDAFDANEVEMLKELSDDLAFGISALHIRANREIAENALRESEERFRLIAENTADTIAVLDFNLKYTYISPSVFKLRGFTIGEVMQQSLENVFTISSLQKVQNAFANHMALEASGKADPYRTETLELEEYCKNGSIIWVEIAVTFIRDKNLKPTGVLTVTRDITKRKLADEKLRVLSRAMEQSPASIIITDIDGKIEYVNPKFNEITGYTLDEVVGNTPRILKSGETSAESYDQLWQNITSGKGWEGEFHNMKKNGELYWELASISPIFDLDGIITHFLAVKEDITARKQTEKELINAKEKAEESDRLKSAFLATMNHELRTPLNHIMGFSDLIQSGINLENATEYAGIIYRSGQNLLEIIEDIFELVIVENTGVFIRKETVKCLDLFLINRSTLTEICDASGKKDQIDLVFSPDDQLLLNYIITDKSKVNQVLINLFKNAVKFTKTGKIEFGFRLKSPGWITFWVSDTGIGIPKDKHEVIFDFFRQADDSDTRNYGGIGIGLAISKKIAEVMGGSISLESETGKGSTFCFTFPAEITSTYTQSIETNHQVNIPEFTGKIVLVVEDDPISMNLIRTFIENTGATVVEAYNGKEAIEKSDEHPDIILMDLNMPVMDGFMSTQIIKSKHEIIPVIAVTAYALIKDKSNAIAAGCDSIISKPVDKEILYAELTKYLKGRF